MAERKKPYDLRERLLLFGKRILEICKKLPNYPECNRIRGQLGACGTSAGANYEEAYGAITMYLTSIFVLSSVRGIDGTCGLRFIFTPSIKSIE